MDTEVQTNSDEFELLIHCTKMKFFSTRNIDFLNGVINMLVILQIPIERKKNLKCKIVFESFIGTPKM